MTWEYIAGFFDGEGTIANNGKGFRIGIPQTNITVLKDIQKFTNFGNICKITKRKSHWKDSWVYYVAKQECVYLFLRSIYPFLIVKKKNASIAISKLKHITKLQHQRRKKFEEKLRKALALRSKGLSYWRIGLEMNLDRGYVRRLIIGKWRI